MSKRGISPRAGECGAREKSGFRRSVHDAAWYTTPLFPRSGEVRRPTMLAGHQWRAHVSSETPAEAGARQGKARVGLFRWRGVSNRKLQTPRRTRDLRAVELSRPASTQGGTYSPIMRWREERATHSMPEIAPFCQRSPMIIAERGRR